MSGYPACCQCIINTYRCSNLSHFGVHEVLRTQLATNTKCVLRVFPDMSLRPLCRARAGTLRPRPRLRRRTRKRGAEDEGRSRSESSSSGLRLSVFSGSKTEAVEEGDAELDRRSVEDHLRQARQWVDWEACGALSAQALAWKRIGRPFHPHLEVPPRLGRCVGAMHFPDD